jgi:hypothetical protein
MSRTGFSLSGLDLGMDLGLDFGFDFSRTQKKAHRLSFTLFRIKSLRY